MDRSVSVFLSASEHDRDREIIKELKTHLAPLEEKNVLFWDRNKIPLGEDKKSTIQRQLKSCDIFVLLISSYYFHFEEKEGELKTAYESLKDGKLRNILMIKTGDCDWKNWPRLSLVREDIQPGQDFFEFPADKTKLSHQLHARESELVNIVRHLRELCLNLQFETDLHKVITLDSLINKLQIVLDDNVISTINLIRPILANPESLKNIRNLELRYIENHKKYNFNFRDYSLNSWKSEKDKIKTKIEEFLKNNLQEKDLKPGWQKTFTNEYLGLSDSKQRSDYFFGLFTPADKVIRPENLSEGEWSEYKRLFIRAQDALAVDSFSEAYQLCLKIRDRVEPESAQLYEYLLLAFFRHTGGEKII